MMSLALSYAVMKIFVIGNSFALQKHYSEFSLFPFSALRFTLVNLLGM